ncbi:MAG: hypothetical protein NTX64_06570 [Elusimicrobia bacterium]|nr:hypothetical protein [Elusimicrobiota bacterium]
MRLFIALESSPEVKAWVGEVTRALTPRGGGLRWVAAENAPAGRAGTACRR